MKFNLVAFGLTLLGIEVQSIASVAGNQSSLKFKALPHKIKSNS